MAHLWARAGPGPKFIVLGPCLGRAFIGPCLVPPWASGFLANYNGGHWAAVGLHQLAYLCVPWSCCGQ